MRILCFGDTHGGLEFDRIVGKEDLDYDLAVCVGDFVDEGVSDYSAPKPTYVIFGNHDAISPGPGKVQTFETAEEVVENSKNITHVEDGTVYTEKGFRISGLNGNYSPKNFQEEGEPSIQPRHFTKDAYEKCLRLKHEPRLDFFLSHEAPEGYADLDWRMNDRHYGIKEVENLMKALEPRFFLTGHIHNLQVDRYKETLVVNTGYGKNGEFVIVDTGEGRIELYEGWDRRLKTVSIR